MCVCVVPQHEQAHSVFEGFISISKVDAVMQRALSWLKVVLTTSKCYRGVLADNGNVLRHIPKPTLAGPGPVKRFHAVACLSFTELRVYNTGSDFGCSWMSCVSL